MLYSKQMEALLGALRRASKKGATALELSERTGIGLNTVRATLYRLVTGGAVEVVGTVQSGRRGRPANLYKRAS